MSPPASVADSAVRYGCSLDATGRDYLCHIAVKSCCCVTNPPVSRGRPNPGPQAWPLIVERSLWCCDQVRPQYNSELGFADSTPVASRRGSIAC